MIPGPGRPQRKHLAALALLFAVNTVNFFDRQILSAVTEPLRLEWGLNDTQIGLLATAFTIIYAFAGMPLGRLSDLHPRKWILAGGLALWSALTFTSGLCRSFASLFFLRLGVGAGEAACAPAATSLIGDLFGPAARARAMSTFMLGLPVGLALSYAVSGAVAQQFGWRAAFFVAGIPGFLLAALCLRLREPRRGEADPRLDAAKRQGSSFLRVLRIPTMRWIILSGAIHNFNMYAVTLFLPALLIRYHGAGIRTAGFVSALVVGGLGGVGMLSGGWAADAAARNRPSGRLVVPAVALLASVPAGVLALLQPQGEVRSFVLYQGLALLLMYVYYGTVYSTIHDVIEPSLRGTAMATYLLAMYVLGASLGPVITGWTSDYFAARAAASAGISAAAAIPDACKAVGLHQAMYVSPLLSLLLAAVLFRGAASTGKDLLTRRSGA